MRYGLRKPLLYTTAVKRHCTDWYEIWALTDHEIYYRARALRALGLLLADGALTEGRAKTFWRVGRFFFYENGRNLETKTRKIDAKVQIEPSFRGLQTGHWQNLGSYSKKQTRKHGNGHFISMDLIGVCGGSSSIYLISLVIDLYIPKILTSKWESPPNPVTLNIRT